MWPLLPAALVARENLQAAQMRVLPVLMVLENLDLDQKRAQNRHPRAPPPPLPPSLSSEALPTGPVQHHRRVRRVRRAAIVIFIVVVVVVVVVVIVIIGIVLLVLVLLRESRAARPLRLADALETDPDPAARLLEAQLGPLLQVVGAGAGEELDAGRGVALVGLEVEVEAQADDAHELEEVDVQQVRLRPIRLPEQRRGWVAQLRDAAAGLTGAHGPGGEGGDLFEAGRERRGGGRCGWVCGTGVSKG